MRGAVVSLGCQHKIYLFNKAAIVMLHHGEIRAANRPEGELVLQYNSLCRQCRKCWNHFNK
ncbi:hypothetical protein EXD76_06230 [BEV proteobacterium]|nr:hypothetical protein [Candidatus Symbiopectobacterium sp. Chty_BC]